MNPPDMAGWNLALRFGLEVAALTGLATAAWRLTNGIWRWPAVVVVPVVAAIAWATFNVPDDPSRSGAAPVVVPGGVRLAVELAVLGAGAAAFFVRGPRWVGLVVGVLILVHYAASTARIEWLVSK